MDIFTPMKKKYINVADYEVKEQHMEYNELASETVPSEQIDLRTLLLNSQNGEIPLMHTGAFSDEDTPDFDKMDFAEIAAYREDLELEIEELKASYHETTVKLAEAQEKVRKEKQTSQDVEQ